MADQVNERRPLLAYIAIALFAVAVAALLTPALVHGF
jgi:hypothetical protein